MSSSTGTVVFNDSRIKAKGVIATESIGVGTANPTSNLHVVGDINFTGNIYQDGTIFSGGGDGWTTSDSNVYYNTGNVGIGKTNPSVELDVFGESKISSNVEIGTANLFVDTTTGNVGVGVANPSYNLHVDGITRLNAYSGSSSGTFSGSGTFYLPPDLDAGGYDGSPHIAWELHLVYGFTGTNLGTFYISGSQDTSSSVVSVSEPGCRTNRPGGAVTTYSTCYLTPGRETQASGYYAIIRLGQAGTGFNIPKLSNITANRFHFMYQSVGCFAGQGASTSSGQGYFSYPSDSRRPRYIRVTCSTGSVQGNWMLKKITI